MLLKILLQGLDPNLQGHQAALALYEKEVGPKPKKVHHFGFLKHVLLEEFGITVEKKYLKEYLLCSLLRGTVQHTVDNVVVRLQ